MKKPLLALGICLAVIAYPKSGFCRDTIRIVGSSSVFPFAAAVAERLADKVALSNPIVESTGSTGGFKAFCVGIGEGTPDVATASRRITAGEFKECARNGVAEIVEIKIGYDGIVLANAAPAKKLDLDRQTLFKALARSVPLNGRWVPNPYTRWAFLGAGLPDREILIYGPAPNHGTRDVLVSLAMEPACRSLPEAKALETQAERSKVCEEIRDDGVFVEVSENYSVVVKKLMNEPRAVAVLSFAWLQNGENLQAAILDGKAPTRESIRDGSYPLARPLYLYLKKARLPVTTGLAEFMDEFTSAEAMGAEGYLAQKGLVPLPEAEATAERAKARALPDLRR